MKWIKNWLIGKELSKLNQRFEDELAYEKNMLREQWETRRQNLELMYAPLKRENERLMSLIIEKHSTHPAPFLVKDN